MSIYITRVELHNSNLYEELHKAMENGGFSRLIEGLKPNVKYHLPTAEYYKESMLSGGDFIKTVESIVSTITHNYSLLVTEAKDVWWVGLEEAKK